MTELCDLSATEARFLIGAKAISPVELMASCLRRIEQVNGPVNGVVALDDQARAMARAAEAAVMRGDALGPLHGLPVGIKDLIDTRGLRTTYGSPLHADQVPEHDDPIVANLRAQGALVFAKTNTPEWGAGGNTFNPVYGVSGNPFAPALTCGGSSGGSAIALSTGMMPIAHGSDNAGSLRIPAAYCGVVGMRPTAGVVASAGRPAGLSHLPVQGPMARTVADTRMLLSAMATCDPIDALATPLRDDAPPFPADLSSLRLAFSADLGFAPLEDGLRATFLDRVGQFRAAFRSAEEATPDFGPVERVYDILRAVNYVGMYAQKMREQPDKWGRLVAENLRDAAQFSVEDAGWALMEQTRIYRRVQQFFERYDVLVTPTVGVHPWPKHDIYPTTVNGQPMRHYFAWVGLTYAITLINHPCISIPCGLDEKGLPFGLQIVGRRNGDFEMMRVAQALEGLLARLPGSGRPLPDLTAFSAA